MQESTQNPQPSQPAPAPQDIHWGIAYLRQDVQELRQDLRQQSEDIQELRQEFRQELRQEIHQLSERFEKVDQRFAGMELRQDAMKDALVQRQDSHFRWLMGTMITLLVSFGSAIIAAIKL